MCLKFINPVGTGGGGVGWACVCVWVMSVRVVSLDSLCKWQVHVSVYCGRQIPMHLGYIL